MADAYVSFDPQAEISGDTLGALVASFLLPQLARDLLVKHGLPAVPEPEQWYTLQAWLDVLSEVEIFYGQQTVYAVGLQVATCSRWPIHLTSLDQALEALDEACKANVRGTSIGYYRTVAHEARMLLVECLTPTPADFECGLITGLAHRFQPADSLRLRVSSEPLGLDAPPLLKRFRIRW